MWTADGATSECEQSFSTILDVGGFCLAPEKDSAVVLDTGPAANLVCFRWLGRHNRLLEKKGRQRLSTYPSSARFCFGDGRLGEVRHATDTSAGFAGNKGKFSTFVLDSDIPALLRMGAMEPPRGSWILHEMRWRYASKR